MNEPVDIRPAQVRPPLATATRCRTPSRPSSPTDLLDRRVEAEIVHGRRQVTVAENPGGGTKARITLPSRIVEAAVEEAVA